MKRPILLVAGAALAAIVVVSPVAAGTRTTPVSTMTASCAKGGTSSASPVPATATSVQAAWTVMNGTTATLVTANGTLFSGSWTVSGTPSNAVSLLVSVMGTNNTVLAAASARCR